VSIYFDTRIALQPYGPGWSNGDPGHQRDRGVV